jgi:adenosylmethionine-8-amino-7-oxononanoate aminotransferase
MPLVREALLRMERELSLARQERIAVLKFVHGYGSTGVGGEICVAVQKRLMEMVGSGEVRTCIFGENWAKSDEVAWKVLQANPEMKKDSDLGRRNRGITIVVL